MRRWVWLLLIPLCGLVYAAVGIGPSEARWYVLCALLVAITETDLRAKMIPDRITFPGAALGIGFAAFDGIHAIGMAALGATIGFCVLEAFRRIMSRIATMEVMGMGDSKLLMMCGAFLGPALVVWSLLPGVLIGLVFGVLYTRVAKSPHFPFGPALGLGALLTGLFPQAITDALHKLPELLRTLDPRARVFIILASLVALVLLMLRMRRRAAEYTEAIERDYASREEDERDAK